jgi:nicotinamidase-related amidase
MDQPYSAGSGQAGGHHELADADPASSATARDRSEPWAGAIPESDLAVYHQAGYGRKDGLGMRPALLIVDATYGFVGDRDEPVSESIRRYPKSSGAMAWSAVRALQQVVPRAREAGMPVIYSINPPRPSAAQSGGWARKTAARAAPSDGPAEWEIVAEIAPAAGDLIIEKTKPSAFFGTPLVSWLVQLQVDTVLVAGGTTSGCVRASVIDAFSYNFRVAVAAEACFDRAEIVHQVNLFDIQQKYGDVVRLEQVLEFVDSVAQHR